jgi:hypothetical protein
MQPSKFTPIIISTVLMTFISLFPFLNLINFLCCAGILGGGFAGAAYYAKQLSKIESRIMFKDGAMIGLLSGFLSALIVVLFTTLITMVTAQNPIPEVEKIFSTYGFTLPPDAQKMMQKISDEYSRSGFSITLTLFNLGAYIVTFPLFGALGGMIATAVYGKRKAEES